MPRKRRSWEIPGAEGAIECRDSEHCTIERAFLQPLLASPRSLAKQGRIVVSKRGEEVRGIKIYGVRRGTLPRLLGLRSGDLIESINGQAITSKQSALAELLRLAKASRATIAYEHRGKNRTLVIDIV